MFETVVFQINRVPETKTRVWASGSEFQIKLDSNYMKDEYE